MAEIIAGIFKAVFLGVGLTHPVTRFIGVATLLSIAEFLVKPVWSFDEKGNMRPWAMPFTNPGPGAVYSAFGVLPCLGGLCAAFFV